MRINLGAIVQDPESGAWYDDGTDSALVSVPPGSETAAAPSDWIGAITGALPKVSAFLTAEQLAQVNIGRAKQGLPALQTSQYAPQVGVGLDPQTKSFITIGGIALAGLVFLPKLLRGRARKR